MQQEKVIIIGSGPAGLTAALYTARANLNPLVIAGEQLGGQVSTTSEIENYPGFPGGLSGSELVENFKEHAERFGVRIVYDIATKVDLGDGSPFLVTTHGGTYKTEALIVAVGAKPRTLNVPGEKEFVGRGVSYCGTCDGFFFRDKEIVVVGGGDSAIEEGLFLTRFASKVEVIHRRDALRAGHTLQKRAFDNPKIHFVWNTVIDAIIGEDGGVVNAVRLRDVETGETRIHPTEGVFIFIGHTPNSRILGTQLETDRAGYVVVDKHMQTSVEGVFAAGEIMDSTYRQVSTSVGQGAAAGISCERWLAERS